MSDHFAPTTTEPTARFTTGFTTRLRRLTLIVILLLAFALRLYHLDFQSLEGDEGISLQRSSQPLGQMMARMPVEHVPGYFVLLNGWLRVAGEHDFALRFLSVWPSVAAVALIFRWAASMGRPEIGAGIGLVAALLLATNSFQIWYAQQARMYSWLLLSSLFSFWALWRMVGIGRAASGIAAGATAARNGDGVGRARFAVDAIYILATALAVYLHYFGFLIPVAQSVFMLIWKLTGGTWRVVGRWAINGALIFLLFLPWLPNTIAFLGFQGWREPLDPWQVPWMMHTAYSVGFPMPQPWQQGLPWLYLVLALVGIGVWWRQNRHAGLLLVVATFVPFVLIFMAVLRNPDYHERYSMFLAAPWIMLMAGGIGALHNAAPSRGVFLPWLIGGALATVLVAGLVTANGLAAQRLYFDTSLHKPDYHGAAYRIQLNGLAGDVVLVDGPNPDLVFNHYYQDYYAGAAAVHDLRPLAGQGYEQVSEALQASTAGASRAWEVLFFRAPGPVQFWLATHGWSSAPTDHNGIRVMLYALDRGPLVEQTLGVAFGAGLKLQAAEVEGPTAQRGDLLRVTTRWQVDAPLPDYKFSLRLLTSAGELVLADDYVPQNWFAPTSQWAVGVATDQRSLLVPLDLPAGSYLVTLRLYDPATGVAVETAAGQDVQLGRVDVN